MDNGKLDQGAELRSLAEKELGADCMQPGDFDRFCRHMLSRTATSAEAVTFVEALDAVGIRIRNNVIADSLMPKLMGSKDVLLLDAINLVSLVSVCVLETPPGKPLRLHAGKTLH